VAAGGWPQLGGVGEDEPVSTESRSHAVREGRDPAAVADIGSALQRLLPSLESFVAFKGPDRTVAERSDWLPVFDRGLPDAGVGLDRVVGELTVAVQQGCRVAHPGFSGFITTGATTAGVASATAAAVAGGQRYLLHAFNALEVIGLRWLATLCGLGDVEGVFCSGGSVANLLALGAARQWAFEQRGIDPAQQGLPSGIDCRIYTSTEAHRTIHRAAAVLGLGRSSVREIATDDRQRLDVAQLEAALKEDVSAGIIPLGIVGIAGTTNTGAIDPLEDIVEVGRRYGTWVHVDGAYGLPAATDPEVQPKLVAAAEADSAIVDPHKWLSTGVGVAAAFVRHPGVLRRAFAEGEAAYIDTSFASDADDFASQFDSMGVNWADMSVELSAPPRGVHVWAVLREIGRDGMRDRVRRHRRFAEHVTQRAIEHPRLEALTDPELSIACIRYHPATPVQDMDALTDRLLARLRRETEFVPTATIVKGALVIRPCYVNPRTTQADVDGLVDSLVRLGDEETS
jgi:aromatic-L-amino-acid decarboxylase